MRVLLLSAYDARSHRYWHEGVVAHLPEVTFEVHTLPARFFSWRFRGNALTWADAPFGPCDAVLSTSMTDLAALKGLNPRLAGVPVALYFHENQFAYPSNEPHEHLIERQITSIYSALAAQRLVFNSEYNRGTFLEGARTLLKRLPDGVPKGTADRLADKADVLPVPLGAECFGRSVGVRQPRDIVWNHRWEADKGPERLAAVVAELIRRKTVFRMHLLGGDPSGPHPEVQRAAEMLRAHGSLGHYGQLPERDDYLACLTGARIVLSTTRHEFQGLAVQEAMALGCLPVVPDRLAYPGYVPGPFRYRSGDDISLEAGAAVDVIVRTLAGNNNPIPMQACSWDAMAGDYRRLLQQVAALRPGSG